MSQLTVVTLAPALSVVLKATLLLGLAGLIIAALRHASAAMRHLVWLLALGGIIALVLITPTAPSVALPIPPLPLLQTALGSPTVTSASAGSTRWSVGLQTVPPSADGGVASATTQTGGTGDDFSSNAPADSRWLDSNVVTAPLLLVIAWLLGFIVVLVRCIAAHSIVAKLVGASTPVSGQRWQQLVRDATAHAGVRRPVAVVLNEAVGGPITSGFTRPVVLLPADADEWTDERRRVVLLHEMAHVARLDYVSQLVATAACSLFWFHPAVWIAASRMRMEAEHAADDRVLSGGLTSDRYAMHLVELARRAAIGEPAAVAVGIAHRTHIERRVRAMLDTTRSRRTISPRAQGAAALLTLFVMVPVAGLRTEASAATATAGVSTVASTLRLSAVLVRPAVAATPVSTRAVVPQERDSTFERTIPAESGGRLMLDLDTGGEVTIHGWDQPRARLRVRLAGRDWRDTRVEFERVDGGIELRSRFEGRRGNTQTAHAFELWVPARSDVKLSSAGGSVTLQEIDGQLSGHTGGGSIDIIGARGRSSISTGGGDVNVKASNLSGTVSTGGGVVVLSQVTGGLRGSSGSGPVIYGEGKGRGGRNRDDMRSDDTTADLRTVTVSSDRVRTVGAGETVTIDSRTKTTNRSSDLGRLHISKMGGAIRLDDAPEGGTVHTGGGDIVIENAGGDLTATTGGGDIEIRRVNGSASVNTGSGDVHITVVDDDGREHTIEASSGHGTIELVLPRSLDARVELETAYTEGFSRRTRIDSDWTLERTESRDWESPNGGTPRKFVRATGVLGSGRGLIRVNTVNGDVIVRRSSR